MPELFDRFGNYFGPAIGNPTQGPQIAVALLLFFSVSGFLFGYLWTRIFMKGELEQADVAGKARINALTKRVTIMEDERARQSEIDARAISLSNQYLTSPDISKVPVLEMKEAIIKASPPVKVQLYYQAHTLRSESWERPDLKFNLDRVIPVFEALVESDIEQRFHQNYGQLAFALKDKRDPDYKRAEELLNQAIELRGDASSEGWNLYEFNRALCRVLQDLEFSSGKPSTPERKAAIVADILVAKEEFPDLHNEPNPLKWLKLNQI